MKMVTKEISDVLYPILMVVGILLSLVCLELFFKKNKLKKGTSTDYELVLTFASAAGVVFAVLFQNLYDFIEKPESYQFTWKMTFFGGLIGGIFTFFLLYFLFIRRKHPRTLPYLLTVAGGAIPLAHAFGRVGCVLAGCCYGKPVDSSSPWYWMGMKFVTTDTKVIPTNLIEAVFLFLLAAVLLALAFRKNLRLTFPLYAICYGLFRFLIEFLRGDDRGAFFLSLSPSQFWAILLFLFGVSYFVVLVLKKKAKLESFENNQ